MRRVLFLTLALLVLPSLGWAQAIKTDDLTAADDAVVADIPGGATSFIISTTGTWDATLTPTFSFTGTYRTLTCLDLSTLDYVTTLTANADLLCMNHGYGSVKVTATIYTSGTATVTIRSRYGAPSGSTAIGAVTLSGDYTFDVNVGNVPTVTVGNLVPTSAPTYAVSPCTIVTTASTNATQCADAPANVYGVYYAINTTTTPAFMRVIDDASSITCTDSPVFVVPIPAASAVGVYGGVALPWVNPVNFAAGVAVCVTSGSDGTGNAPAGIIILVGVKE